MNIFVKYVCFVFCFIPLFITPSLAQSLKSSILQKAIEEKQDELPVLVIVFPESWYARIILDGPRPCLGSILRHGEESDGGIPSVCPTGVRG